MYCKIDTTKNSVIAIHFSYTVHFDTKFKVVTSLTVKINLKRLKLQFQL